MPESISPQERARLVRLFTITKDSERFHTGITLATETNLVGMLNKFRQAKGEAPKDLRISAVDMEVLASLLLPLQEAGINATYYPPADPHRSADEKFNVATSDSGVIVIQPLARVVLSVNEGGGCQIALDVRCFDKAFNKIFLFSMGEPGFVAKLISHIQDMELAHKTEAFDSIVNGPRQYRPGAEK